MESCPPRRCPRWSEEETLVDAPQPAERLVHDRLRRALDREYRLYPNVRWVSHSRAGGPARDGETDLVIAHPDQGLLVVETKGGSIRRDGEGRWFSGNRLLDPSPFRQAEESKRHLVNKLMDLPDWPSGKPRAGHAVAFPAVDLESLGPGARLLGTDAPAELVLDGEALATDASARGWVEDAYEFWVGDGTGTGRPLGHGGMLLVQRLLAPVVELRSLLRRELDEAEESVVTLTRGQVRALATIRGVRRAAVVGPAGSGKTLVAAEMAQRFVVEGYQTLLVCFNQPLARMLAEHAAGAVVSGRLTVSTFHELCLRLGREAGVIGEEPVQKDRAWFDRTLPAALDAAIPTVGGRYQAVIVDEGQDFERSWLESLDLLLSAPGEDVLFVFHDPCQALYRPDPLDSEEVRKSLRLRHLPMLDNCRNSATVHDLAARFYTGEGPISALREDGRRPEIIVAEEGAATLEALRRLLHRLVREEQVAPWRIAVLSGGSHSESAVWRQRVFGSQVLWNGNYDAEGRSLGLSADEAVEEPTDTILFDTIRRFKGLEREIVVLVELRADDPRLEQVLYVGISRARHHLVVIAPAAVAERLR